MTFREALELGKRRVRYPVNVVLIGSTLLTLVSAYVFSYGVIFLVIGLITSFIITSVVYNYQVGRWMLETFSQVNNVKELKRRAIMERLIWPDDSFFGKRMMFSRSQKLKIAELERQKENNLEDETLADDGSTPEITEIKYSIWLSVMYGLGTLLSIVGLSWALTTGESLLSLICLAFTGYNGYKFYSIGLNRNPILTLDSKGGKSPELGFTSWAEIKEITTYTEGYGKRMKYVLWIYTKSNSETVDYGMLDMKRHDIEERITIYRQRSNN